MEQNYTTCPINGSCEKTKRAMLGEQSSNLEFLQLIFFKEIIQKMVRMR